jgi:hypothetical protein
MKKTTKSQQTSLINQSEVNSQTGVDINKYSKCIKEITEYSDYIISQNEG